MDSKVALTREDTVEDLTAYEVCELVEYLTNTKEVVEVITNWMNKNTDSCYNVSDLSPRHLRDLVNHLMSTDPAIVGTIRHWREISKSWRSTP